MRRDELRQPLQRRTMGARLWSKRPGLLTLAYTLVIAAFTAGGYVAVKTPNPFAGEPLVVAKIPKAEEIITASTAPAEEPGPAPETEAVAEPDPAATKKPAYTVVEPVETELEVQEAAVVIKPRNALAPAPESGLIETTSAGELPRISENGKRPSKVYARSVSMNEMHSAKPKIVIILGGMGINANATRMAARNLPADITFAFAPYGENLQVQVNDARKQGHEVLLQVPLEPMNYPATNPGPKTLLADAGADENREALHWHMARFAGYTGIVNYMGGRFLANPSAVRPLLSELKKRGLYFFEDGSMATTAVNDVAPGTNSARRAEAVIDANPDPQSITAALALLEAEAEKNGIAIGTGSGLPDTIEAVKQWAKEAADRGVLIIPASAAFQSRSG